ncbi:MAG: hypothetical protein WCH44_04310 [Betaproteobacteria bacterium]
MNATPGAGRVCPLRYRYGATAIAQAPEREASTLYLIGGLYGNVQALDTIEAMAAVECVVPCLCFNGDFNWFNVADGNFEQVNQRVLAHDAILGNVEAELDSPADDAGCGCAYPESVDSGTVERSNQIHRRLKATALHHPEILKRIATLPMLARYRVGPCRVGVVHGDAESLAGWRFDVNALDDTAALPWLRSAFAQANVDLFASTHTCLPALRRFALTPSTSNSEGCVVNNGAAGMPNFRGDRSGLITRVATTPSPHASVCEVQLEGAYVALLPVSFDTARWQQEFLAQWPVDSAAWLSYNERMSQGPSYDKSRAIAFLPTH